MADYTSNSHRSKEEKREEVPGKSVEKVVTGAVKTKKKSEVKKFVDVFLPDDVSNVKQFIFMDVMIPAFKKVVMDAVEAFLYNGVTGSNRRGSSVSSRISYNSMYDNGGSSQRRSNTSGRANVYDYNDIILESRGEAEDVLACMDELIAKYGMISVSDYYDLVGVTGSHTDNKYGWTDIRNSSPVRNRDGGYTIKLPRAIPL
jgi:hypothetical protein